MTFLKRKKRKIKNKLFGTNFQYNTQSKLDKTQKKCGKGYNRCKAYEALLQKYKSLPAQWLILYVCLSSKEGPTLQVEMVKGFQDNIKKDANAPQYLKTMDAIAFKQYLIDYFKFRIEALLKCHGHNFQKIDKDIIPNIIKAIHSGMSGIKLDAINTGTKKVCDDTEGTFKLFADLVTPQLEHTNGLKA